MRKFSEIEKLKDFERVSGAVSEKYVPIYTSKIVEALKDWEFIDGIRYTKGRTFHSVKLKKNDDYIIIDNSFDRSRAFSFKLVAGNTYIPLGLNRVIHRGEGAGKINDEIAENPEAINEAVKNAKLIANKLDRIPATETFKKAIIDTVFEKTKNAKNFDELDLIIGYSYDTVKKYVDTVVDRYIDGEYYIVKTDGKIRKGRKIKSKYREVEVKNKVFKTIIKEYPELIV
jgi:hypothetical protein